MFILRFLSIIGFTLPLLVIPTSSPAADKKSAQVECAATDVRLAYDCIITLTNKKTRQAIKDAEFTVSADMTSMPGAHSVEPVAVMNHGMGMYHVQLVLEMYGEWALIMDFTLPKRDRVVTKVTITKTGGGSTPKP
ncbi:MAG: FixH family protein [Gammaproteobacteria bacterium]|nr:FixH family protein [Gammaproteobacteria bacterium]